MKIAVYGGSKKFISFLKGLTESVKTFKNLNHALCYAEKQSTALFILPFYDKGINFVKEFSENEFEKMVRIIKSKKSRIYIENYPAYDYRDCFVLGLQARSLVNNIGKNSICLCNRFKNLTGFEILQKRNGFYYPNDKFTDGNVEILAEIKNCFGVSKAVKSSAEWEGVALLKAESNVYSAMCDFTNLKDFEIFSYKNWLNFYKTLFSEVTDASHEIIEKSFENTYKKIDICKNTRDDNIKKALENAVKSALDWHESSGIMLSNGGVYEMIRSFDLTPAKNIRGDSGLFTAALFMTAGKYFNNKKYIKTAEKVADYMLKTRALQITKGENKGLFKWFSGIDDMGPHDIYVSDTSRVGNCVLTLYKLTGKTEYREKIISLGEALLKWFDGDALLPGCSFNYQSENLVAIQTRPRKASPEFYDAPMLFMKNLYSITNDRRYKDQILKTAKKLAILYPYYETVTSHSDSFTFSRLFCVFAVAQSFGDGEWTPVIDKILSFFEKLQHKSGGFSDKNAYFDNRSLSLDLEFAVGGFAGEDSNIADLVYCQNSLFYSLNILLSCNGNFDKNKAKTMFEKLTQFLLDTQIRSENLKINGAWMRAFDMDNYEYYGCDKDFAWGPYCILTGWVTGAIPLVFLDLLGVKTIY